MVDGNGNRAQLHYDGFDRQDCWIFPLPTGPSRFDDSTPATALNTAGAISGDCVTSGDYERYGYDPAGNRTSLRKRDGSILNYQYDALNRMTVKSISTQRSDLNPAQTRPVYYSYNLQNLQLSARFDSQTGEGTTNSYDALGHLISTSTNMGGTTRTLTYQYDAHGNRIRITHPDINPSTLDYNYFTEDYDGLDRPVRIRENTATSTDPTTYLMTIYYNPDGTPESLLRGSTSPAAYAYTTYAHDPLGRLTDLTHLLAGGGNLNVHTGYSYSPASEVVSATRDNDLYAWTRHYAVNRPYTTNGLNQYSTASATTYTYDANGNLTASVSHDLSAPRVRATPPWSTIRWAGSGRARTRARARRRSTSMTATP
jgi:YD repeat-containing protein